MKTIGNSTKHGLAVAVAFALTTMGNTALAEDGDEQGGDEAGDHSSELVQLRQDSIETRRELQTSILVSGIASIAIGVGMAIPNDYDQGIRYAGLSTLAFGAINTVVGAVALSGISAEAEWDAANRPQTAEDYQRYREHALADEAREGWAHGINLGLAGAYAAIGGMAVVVSQLNGVKHPNRWLGSGVAVLAQAGHLAVVDLIGTVMARDFEERMRNLSPSFAYDPETGSGFAGASYQGSF